MASADNLPEETLNRLHREEAARLRKVAEEKAAARAEKDAEENAVPWETKRGQCPVKTECCGNREVDLTLCSCGHWACNVCCASTFEDGKAPLLTCDNCAIVPELNMLRVAAEGDRTVEVRVEGERPEDRNTPFHKRIVKAEPILNTIAGNTCTLECGHVVQTFGDLKLADGKALCMRCREEGS
jgi:hypothetical protein